jgi:GntR family transcriptional regulator
VVDTINPLLDFGHNRAPIYVQLSTLFRRFIVSGQWPVAQQIPTLVDLAAQFEVNPATVGKAIEILADEGLVERYRRHGTFVTAKPAPVDWLTIPTDWTAAVVAFEGLDVECLSSHHAKNRPTPFHGGTPAPGYQITRRLYRRQRLPVLLEDSFVDLRLRQGLGGRRADNTALLRRLGSCPGLQIGRAEETILFGIADGEISTLLAVPLNAPLAVVHLSIRDDDDVLIAESKIYYRGDAVRVSEPIQFA